MKKFFIILFVFVASTINAQWSSDPLENTLIDGNSGEQSVPHIVKTSNGNYFISYYSSASGNYDVYLHYFNSLGEPIWDNPVLVSDNDQNSWVTDYALAIDNEDNAIVAFNDVRNGDMDIFIYKINVDGLKIWGDDGIQLSTSSFDDFVPSLAVTDNNNIAVSWTVMEDSTIVLQKLSADGDFLWGANGIVIEPTGDYYNAYPYIVPMNGEKIYFNYSHVTGPYWAPNRDMFIQLLDENGLNVWANEIEVFNAGGLSGLTELSNYISDDKLLYFTWHDDRAGDMIVDPYLQCIDSTGSLLYPSNGTLLSNSTSNNQFDPRIAGVSENDEAIVFWTDTDGSQNNRGVFGQKISPDGTLNWGSNGMQFNALGSVTQFVNCFLNNGEIVYFFDKQITTFDGLFANKVDTDGSFVWENEVGIATTDNEKIHTDIVMDETSMQFVAVWGEERTSSRDLFAQNLNFDGTIGVFINDWDAEILEYSIDGIQGDIDSTNRTISIDLGDVDTTMFIADFVLSDGATAFIDGIEQESGVTISEFVSGVPVVYTVVSFDESITNDWEVTVTYNHIGVYELSEELSIYPIPANDVLYIKGLDEGTVKLQNIHGQILYSSKIYSKVHQIGVADLNSGIYFLIVEQGNSVRKQKVIISH